MAETKRISINALERVMKETYVPTEEVEWNGIDVCITKTLSLPDMMLFVDSVTKSCFTEDGVYMPEVKDFAIKSCIVEMYAGFAMPSNVEMQYELLYKTDVVDMVLGYINTQQFKEICRSIDKKVKNLAQANIESINKQMNELQSSFDEVVKQMEGTFGDVSNEDIQKIVSAISSEDGALDAEKLMKAYVNATKDESEASNETDGGEDSGDK